MYMSSVREHPPSFNARNTDIMKISLPSQTLLKKYKVEIQLDQPLSFEESRSNNVSHFYRPGDLINGEIIITPPIPNESKSSQDLIHFNEITIQLDCKLINNTGAGTKTLFTMNDNPETVPNSMSCVTRFPFQFKLPEQLLDNVCPANIKHHVKSLPPSFASPRLCNMAFSANQNAGAVPTVCPYYDTFKGLPFNRFCVVYFITATLGQRFNESADPFVLFKRVLDIQVKNNFEPVPTNIMSTSFDIASHYLLTDVNSSNELLVVKSTSLKKDGSELGSLTSSTTLPPPISLSSHSAENNQHSITLKFKPSNKTSSFPKFHYTAELTQYVIQSSACLPATANPGHFPQSFHVDQVGKTRRVIERVQSIDCHVLEDENWIPDYEDQEVVSKDIKLEIPYLGGKKTLQPTFHSCVLQNLYALRVKIELNNLGSDSDEIEKTSSLFRKMKLQKTGSAEKVKTLEVVDGSGVVLDIPFTILS